MPAAVQGEGALAIPCILGDRQLVFIYLFTSIFVFWIAMGKQTGGAAARCEPLPWTHELVAMKMYFRVVF